MEAIKESVTQIVSPEGKENEREKQFLRRSKKKKKKTIVGKGTI